MLSASIVLLAFAATGIQFGSEALPSGGNTYIVQIEPELIDTFREKGFSSDVPPGLRDIRRIEIRVGTAPLPNQGLTVLKVPSGGAADATKPPRLDAAADDPGSKHVADSRGPKSEPMENSPKKLSADLPANSLSGKREHTAEQASFQSRERSAPAADGGPSAAAATLANSNGKRAASPNDSESEWASIPLLAALGALIVSASGNLYLAWVHMGTRRRYREVVNQLHESELPIAIEK
jgi:hypothetical protein